MECISVGQTQGAHIYYGTAGVWDAGGVIGTESPRRGVGNLDREPVVMRLLDLLRNARDGDTLQQDVRLSAQRLPITADTLSAQHARSR
jgi:hypothetical protein